jgi:hypothetical protein
LCRKRTTQYIGLFARKTILKEIFLTLFVCCILFLITFSQLTWASLNKKKHLPFCSYVFKFCLKKIRSECTFLDLCQHILLHYMYVLTLNSFMKTWNFSFLTCWYTGYTVNSNFTCGDWKMRKTSKFTLILVEN